MAIQTKCHACGSYSDILVNVVDALQGREGDRVVFSVTRSEVQGLSFFREMERICQADADSQVTLALNFGPFDYRGPA